MSDRVTVAVHPFDVCAEVAKVRADNARVGGVVSFLGLMRDFNDGTTVESMVLEHYPGMTESALEKIVEEAVARWNLEDVRVVHRVGEVLPEEPIVLVAVASAHRGEAFRACEFIIDYLKTRAPFWKKEKTSAGARWVDARTSDTDAEARWQNSEVRSESG
jgi:molybdopterin synthase catalytic subunit